MGVTYGRKSLPTPCQQQRELKYLFPTGARVMVSNRTAELVTGPIGSEFEREYDGIAVSSNI